MKKGYVFGFFVDENEKIIFLSSTFMNGAKVMSSGEYQLYMQLLADFPNYKRVVIK